MKRLGALVGLLALAPAPALAQRLAIEGLGVGEVWKTDTGSTLLKRNAGRLAAQGRLFLWGSWRPVGPLELLAVTYAQGGTAEDKDFEFDADVLEARYTAGPALVVEGGKLLMPIGTFGSRRFADLNPVVGIPDLYPPIYPWGTEVSGTVGLFDYRAAAVDQPVINPRYVLGFGNTLAPGRRLRPAAGAGVTLGPALHLGAAWTRGPYLGPDAAAWLPGGTTWRSFDQSVVSTDAHASIGYLDVHAEAAWSSYDVPNQARPVKGFGWYAEPKFTITPRLFAAARLEHYRYAFVGYFGSWVGNAVTENNGEVGVGYWFTPAGLGKLSLRKDDWPPPHSFPSPDGYAVAMQFAWRFSAAGLIQRTY